MANIEMAPRPHNNFSDIANEIGRRLVYRLRSARATWHRDFDFGFGTYTGEDEQILSGIDPTPQLPAATHSPELE